MEETNKNKINTSHKKIIFKLIVWVVLSVIGFGAVAGVYFHQHVLLVSNPQHKPRPYVASAQNSISYRDVGDNTYSASDLIVGDYIDGFGGMKWRVVGKDDSGIKLLANTTIGPMEMIKADAIVYNTIINFDGIDHINDRGSNLYFESEIRRYLNDEFLDQFSQSELESIQDTTYDTTVWPGHFKSQFEMEYGPSPVTNPLKTVNVSTEKSLLGGDVSEEKYINRFVPKSEVGGTGLTLNVPKDAVDSVHLPGASADVTYNVILDKYRHLSTYSLSDKVYIPSILEYYDIRDNTGLKNEEGNSVIRTQDSSGHYSFGIWTRSPNMTANFQEQDFGDTKMRSLVAGGSYYTLSEKVYLGSNSARYGDSPTDYPDVVPMLNLKLDTKFYNLSVATYNKNEEQVTRPTQVGESNQDYRNFVVYDSGETIESIDASAFGNVSTGDRIDIELFGYGHRVNAGLGLGIDLIDGKEHIIGILQKAGNVEFTLTRTRTDLFESGSATFSIDVAKGIILLRVPKLVANQGDKLSDVILPTESLGVWSWDNPDEVLNSTKGETVEENGRTYLVLNFKATFTPNDIENYEKDTRDVAVNILLIQETSFFDSTIFWVLVAGGIGGVLLGVLLYVTLRKKSDKGDPPPAVTSLNRYRRGGR